MIFKVILNYLIQFIIFGKHTDQMWKEMDFAAVKIVRDGVDSQSGSSPGHCVDSTESYEKVPE